MFFHWQPELAPRVTDSGATRYLITSIPTTAYVFDGDRNITLQSAGQHISNSLNGLKLEVPNLKGGSVLWSNIKKNSVPIPPFLPESHMQSPFAIHCCRPWI